MLRLKRTPESLQVSREILLFGIAHAHTDDYCLIYLHFDDG